jgi:ABC-type transporter MlaC component
MGWISLKKLEGHMRKNRFFTVVLLLFSMASPAATRGGSDEIVDFVRFFFRKTGEINGHSRLEKESEFLALANDNIDIDWIASFVLGKHRKSLGEEQKDQFIDAYSNYLVNSYRSILGIYSSSNYEILSVTEQQRGKVFIVATVLSFSGKNVRNNFRVIKKNNKYYITDVITEGISFISAKRAEIDATIASKGFDSFLRELKSSTTVKNKK